MERWSGTPTSSASSGGFASCCLTGSAPFSSLMEPHQRSRNGRRLLAVSGGKWWWRRVSVRRVAMSHFSRRSQQPIALILADLLRRRKSDAPRRSCSLHNSSATLHSSFARARPSHAPGPPSKKVTSLVLRIMQITCPIRIPLQEQPRLATIRMALGCSPRRARGNACLRWRQCSNRRGYPEQRRRTG